MGGRYHQIKEKLLLFRLNRSHDRLQIKLYMFQKKFRIILCFPSEDWFLTADEREFVEDLLENELSIGGWYLKPRYELCFTDKSCFKYECFTVFTVRHQ